MRQIVYIKQFSDMAAHLLLLIGWSNNHVIEKFRQSYINAELWIVAEGQYKDILLLFLPPDVPITRSFGGHQRLEEARPHKSYFSLILKGEMFMPEHEWYSKYSD